MALLPALLAVVGPAGASGERGSLRLAWSVDLGRALGERLERVDDRLVVTTLDRRCVLLRLGDGRILWERRLATGLQGGARLVAGRVLGVTDPPDGRLFCLSGVDGGPLWEVETGEVTGVPCVAGDRVCVATLGGHLLAFALDDGRQVWKTRLPGLVRASPVPVDSLLLVGTLGDSLLAYGLDDGRRHWGAAPGGALYAPPVAAAGWLWTLSYEGTLTAWEASSGRVMARTTLAGPFRAGLAGGRPLVAVSTRGTVTAIDPDAVQICWERELDVVGDRTPTRDGDLVWVGLRDGSVHALRVADGQPETSLQVVAPVAAPPVAGRGFLLVAGGRGQLAAYRWEASVPDAPHQARPAGETSESGEHGQSGLAWDRRLGRPWLAALAEGTPRWGGATSSGAWLAQGEGGGVALRGRSTGEGRGAGSRWQRWAMTLGWGASAGMALWLQDAADEEYDRYLTRGEAGGRQRAFDRARRYDRAVIGTWIVSEVFFLLAVRAWLGSVGGEG